MTSIASRVAMITGAGNGIGRGTAIAFAQRGAKLVLVDIDAEGLAETAAQVEAAGAEVLPITIDIAREDAFVSVRDQVATRFGTVDIVMNNVGVIIGGRFHEIPLTEWERIINLNLMSVIRAIHLFLPDLLAKGVGHIVNTASFAGLFPYAYDRLPYAAAKGGLVTMTEGLALYLKPLGIGVTLLCPGPVKTQIGRSLRNYSTDVSLRGPGMQFDFMEAEAVGELVARAVEENRFFLPTDEKVRPIMAARGADLEAFLLGQIAGMV